MVSGVVYWNSSSDPLKKLAQEVLAGGKAGDFTLQSCTLRNKGHVFQAECGTILLPENREQPEGKLIALPVVRFLSTSENPADPIFWLNGGPGNTNISWWPNQEVLAQHEVVLVGYRGIDGSSNMVCPNMNQAVKGDGKDMLSEASLEIFGEGIDVCAQSLIDEGYDLDHYTPVQVVEDFDAVRDALGYKQINLLGGSYGTRVAYLYGRMFPESIHRALLVGTNPDGGIIVTPQQLEPVFARYDQFAAQDLEFNPQSGSLSETIRQVIAEAPDHWLFLPIDKGELALVLYIQMFHRQTSPQVFDAVLAAEQGDYSGLALLSNMGNFIFPVMLSQGDFFAKGYSMDLDPEKDYKTLLTDPDSPLGSPLSYLLFANPGEWPAERVSAELREMGPVEMEALLINGGLDVITPPGNLDVFAAAFPNGQKLLFEEMGHVSDIFNLQPDAFTTMALTYFASGKVDDSGFVPMPVDFSVGFGYPQQAKLLVGVLTMLGVGLLWGAYALLRRWLG
jgi:pimeloyl-ACP methyl ester carboxylesterase